MGKEEEIKRAAEKEKVAKLEKEKEKVEVKPDPPKPITKVPKVEKVESIEEIKFCKPTSSLDLERVWRSMKTTAQKADYLRFINDAALTARCFTSQLPKYIVDIC